MERTFSWLNHSCRLAKDFEIAVDSAVAMVRISRFHTLLKSLRIKSQVPNDEKLVAEKESEMRTTNRPPGEAARKRET